jgi:hypothetical protein
MMMGVDQAWKNYIPFQIKHLISRASQFRSWTHLLDESIPDEQPAINDLTFLVIKGG